MIEAKCGRLCVSCDFRNKCGCGVCIETDGQSFNDACSVADCCKNKDIVFCGECSEFPCDLLMRFLHEHELGDTPKCARIEKIRELIQFPISLEKRLENANARASQKDGKVLVPGEKDEPIK